MPARMHGYPAGLELDRKSICREKEAGNQGRVKEASRWWRVAGIGCRGM